MTLWQITKNHLIKNSSLLLLALFLSFFCTPQVHAGEKLDQSVTFIGSDKFQKINEKAIAENWRALPMGDRMAKIALELNSVPYKAYTLEIHNTVESPSVNFRGLDCWTFFETVMAMAKMLETPKKTYTESDLLKQIEHTRYRGGTCNGNYLDRIHYLAEWYEDNHKRKNITDITKNLPTKTILMQNQCNEMSKLWKHYRYLKHSPDLRHLMAVSEKEMTAMNVSMIPKANVANIEDHLQNGDIIGIARHGDGSYCSHVGIIIRDQQAKARFMHASTTYKKVVIDSTISEYLYKFDNHAGILVARAR